MITGTQQSLHHSAYPALAVTWSNWGYMGLALIPALAWGQAPAAAAGGTSTLILDESAYWRYHVQFGIDRISPELERAFQHFPAIGRAGIQRFVNGPFTFSPDGNPLVGPIRGMRNMWMANAVMAGLSQGGGVGLSLANWMVHGDPGADIWGMDVARYGDYATLAYTNAKVRENYSRRFRITFPNEELPAGRPLLRHADPITRLTDYLTLLEFIKGI